MSYSDSNFIGLLMLMPNANSYDFPSSNHSPFSTSEFGFTSQHQPYHSCFGYSRIDFDSPDRFFNGQNPHDSQIGCRVENTELILFNNEDCNGDPRNLYYEFDWDSFQSWFGLREDEQDLKPENDCNSDAMALLEAILGY